MTLGSVTVELIRFSSYTATASETAAKMIVWEDGVSGIASSSCGF